MMQTLKPPPPLHHHHQLQHQHQHPQQPHPHQQQHPQLQQQQQQHLTVMDNHQQHQPHPPHIHQQQQQQLPPTPQASHLVGGGQLPHHNHLAVDQDDPNPELVLALISRNRALEGMEMSPMDVDEEDAEVPSSSSANLKRTFQVKKWEAVALWAWDIEVENCAICRNHIMDLCIECQAAQSSDTRNECPIAWGQCKHAFHFHCISRWLKSRPVCPLDNKEWDYHKIGH